MLPSAVEVIDAQVHIWAKPTPERPWDPSAKRIEGAPEQVTTEEMIAAMDAVGVDAAVIFTPAVYGLDNSYSLEAAERYSGRFAVAGCLDPTDPDIEETVRTWRSQPGMLAIRMPLYRPSGREQWRAGLYDPVLAAAQRHGVPVCTYPPGLLRELAPAIRAFPDLQLVLDHLGLPQPTPYGTRDPQPFRHLPELLELAELPNVAVKLSAAPTLSLEPFPFRDLWPPIHRVIEAFGIERVMWGSDWTRVVHLHSYAEALAFVAESDELSESDLEWLLGRSLRRVLGWQRS